MGRSPTASVMPRDGGGGGGDTNTLDRWGCLTYSATIIFLKMGVVDSGKK